MDFCDICQSLESFLGSEFQDITKPAYNPDFETLDSTPYKYPGLVALDTPFKYRLHDSTDLIKSAKQGCKLCQFFYNSFESQGGLQIPECPNLEQPIFLERHFPNLSGILLRSYQPNMMKYSSISHCTKKFYKFN